MSLTSMTAAPFSPPKAPSLHRLQMSEDLAFFFSAEGGARKGGGALGGPPRIANGDAGTTFSSTGSGGLGGIQRPYLCR